MTDKEIVERKPLFKQGDILYEISDGSKIEIIDIVADQYKFECGDEYPHYEFFGYIESNYTKEPQVKESAEIERDKETCKENGNSLTLDGVITFDYYEGDKAYGCVAHDSFCLDDWGLKDMDKVKILILKKVMSYD
jgi:hypothetical protein